MPAGKHRETVLVISNISWDFIWQRHQTMATLFAREHDVLFCEIPGIRRVRLSDGLRVLARLLALRRKPAAAVSDQKNIRLLRPFVLPATNRFFCAFNSWQMRRLVRREATLRNGIELIFNYSASRTALALISQVQHRGLIYDCTDDWLEVKDIPSFLAADERSLLQRANLTLVPSRTLFDRKNPLARRCRQLPHGALVERFEVPPKQRSDDGKLTLLYYGHLHRQHLDFDLIAGIARARSDWRILLVGPVKTPGSFPGNVELAGQQPHDELRRFIGDADVILLPYVLNEYTQAVMPAKTYECLATGRPVVATPLPELVSALGSYFKFATGHDAWVEAISRAVADDNEAARNNRVAEARRNSWDARFVQLNRMLGEEGLS